MPVSPSPTRRRSIAGVLALLSCAAVLTLSACDTSAEAPAGGSGGSAEHGGEHGGGHPAERPTEHGGTHPSSEHHTTAPPSSPSSRPSEFDPNKCPPGLVC